MTGQAREAKDMDDNGWEERMAERAKIRAAAAVAQPPAAQAARDKAIKAGRPWLNGWARIGPHMVLIGTGVHCVCCGQCLGTTCVAFPPAGSPPGPTLNGLSFPMTARSGTKHHQ